MQAPVTLRRSLHIEFTSTIFYTDHYPHRSDSHAKNCYPMLFSSKVIGERRGKNPDGDGGANQDIRVKVK